jgi:menaquinone-dependent protoporphyrinogen oxidase
MKVLAVYGSEYGQAEMVLRRVASALEEHGHVVSIFRGDAPSAGLALEDSDAVVVAASVIRGRYQSYIRAFVRRHLAALEGRSTAFISVSGASPETAPEWRAAARGYVQLFLKDTGWAPGRIATFSGALRYPRYGLFLRWVMKRISRSSGGPTDTSREFEFTDWSAVDRFSEELIGAFATGPTLHEGSAFGMVPRRAS